MHACMTDDKWYVSLFLSFRLQSSEQSEIHRNESYMAYVGASLREKRWFQASFKGF